MRCFHYEMTFLSAFIIDAINHRKFLAKNTCLISIRIFFYLLVMEVYFCFHSSSFVLLNIFCIKLMKIKSFKSELLAK